MKTVKKNVRSTPESTPLEDFLINSQRVATALSEGSIFGDHNVSVSEWAMLKSLVEGEQLPMKQAARNTGVSRQRIRKVLAQLEAKGLATVSMLENGDKRLRVAVASPEAVEIVHSISAKLNELGREIGEGSGSKTFANGAHSKAFANGAQVARRLARALAKNSRHEETDAEQ